MDNNSNFINDEQNKELLYIMFSVYFENSIIGKGRFMNISITCKEFPSMEEINELILEKEPFAIDIILLSISELSKEKIEKLFGKRG